MAERLTDINFSPTGPNSTEGVVELWEFWATFGIDEAEMIGETAAVPACTLMLTSGSHAGWWDDANPVGSSSDDVKVTVYKKPSSTLIAVGNFGAGPATVKLTFNVSNQLLGCVACWH